MIMASIFLDSHLKPPNIVIECVGLITYPMCVQTIDDALECVSENPGFVLLDPSQAMFIHPFPALLFDIPIFEHLLASPELLGLVMIIPGDQQLNRQYVRDVYLNYHDKIYFADSRHRAETLLESLHNRLQSH